MSRADGATSKEGLDSYGIIFGPEVATGAKVGIGRGDGRSRAELGRILDESRVNAVGDVHMHETHHWASHTVPGADQGLRDA